MRLINPEKISEIVKGKILKEGSTIEIDKVYQDSRLIEGKCTFFAINGDAFDGHNYIESAIEKGAKVIVFENEDKVQRIKENPKFSEVWFIEVENSISALALLAKYYLKIVNPIKIGVTGSTGKTSTRDMIYYVASQKFNTHRNQGNFNTLVGVSLTILDMSEDVEVAVLEMGMDRAGEIAEIVDLVNPDISVITNIGISHLENFKSQDGIFNAKMEIANNFTEENTLVVTYDKKYLNNDKIKGEFKLITTGDFDNTDYRISDIKETSDFSISFKVTRYDREKIIENENFDIPVPGRHNTLNATIAIAVGNLIGISMKEAAKGLGKIKLTGKRLSIKEIKGMKIIDDTYNASPDSMRAAIDILAKTKGNRHVAVLGDMYELGENENEYHQQIGIFAKEKADVVYTIGKLTKNMNSDIHYNTIDEFIEEMNDLFKNGDVILFKASRGMALDKVVDVLINS